MKIARILLGLVVVAGLVGVVVQPAYAAGYTYFSGFQVQNLEASPATVTINFIDGTGAVKFSLPDTIDANGSKNYYPLPSQLQAGFNGSVVISSNTRLASVVNIQATNPVPVSASYVGASSGSTSVQLPLLMKGNSGYNTWYSVQNVGSSATNLSVVYSDGTTASATNVPPSASFVFKQVDESHPNLKVFSAVVTSSTSPIAATVVEEGTDTVFAYSGFNSGSKAPVMPLINTNNVGYQTGVQIQNLSGTSTNVTLSYMPAQAGKACTETQTIAAGQSATFALYPFAGVSKSFITTTCVKEKFIGSAKVTANSGNSDLVAVVNQFKSASGEAYGAFDPNTATAGVVMPLIMDRRGNAGQYWTGISIMNVGTSAVDITCTFTNTSYTVTQTVQPDASLVDLQQGKIASNYAGSGTCTTSSGKIVGIVNELSQRLPGDNLLVYEAISK